MKRIITALLSAIALLGWNQYASAQCTGTPITNFTVTNLENVSCFGSSDGEIEVTLVGGEAPFTYTLLLETGGGDIQFDQKANTSDQFAIFTGLSANAPLGGTYKVSVVTSNGGTPLIFCSRRTITNIDVTQPAQLTASVASITSACTPGTGAISLNVAGGTPAYTFIWSGPTAIGNVEDPTNLNAGSYDVIIRDANYNAGNPGFCETSITGIVVPAGPTSAVLSGTTSICAGSSTNLTVTITGGVGPYSFTIDNGVGLINNYNSGDPIPVNPGATTTYNIVGNVTDAGGCTVAGSGSATVTVNPSITSAVLSGNATVCSGTNTNLIVTITGGTGPFSFTIDNGVGVINNYNSGDPIPVSPGATTTYNIVGNVTDAAGCTVAGSGSATVTVNPSPTSGVLSGTTSICAGDNTNLTVTITGGTGPFSFTIDNGVGLINNYNSGDPIPVSPGATTTYNIVGNVTDASGCTVAGSGSATVTVNPAITSAVLSGNATICSGAGTNLIVTVTGGTGPYSFTIDNGVGLINNYNSGDPIPVNPGATTTYNIVGNVTDASGCTVAGSGSATVTVNPSPTSAVLSGTTTICTGGTTNLTVTITGGTGPYSFTIDNGVGLINNYNSGDPIPVSPGATTTYNIVGNVTDASGCTVAGSGSATVTVTAPPVSAVLSGNATICAGNNTNLIVTITGGTGPFSFTIDNGVGLINNYNSGDPISVSPGVTTIYNIVGNVTDASGCTVAGSGSATITVNPAITSAVLSGNATICSGTNTNLIVTITGGTGPYSLTLDNGVGLINNYNSGDPIPVSPAATTTYNIVGNVTDASGCTVAGSGSATVTVNPSPTSAVLSGTTTICTGGSTNLTVTITGGTGPYSFTIDNGVGLINNYNSGDPIPVSPAATTTYNIVGNVTDANGCSVAGSGSATVTVTAPPASAVLSGNATICAGNNTNLIVTITGGTGPFSFTIDNGVGLINNYNSGDPISVSPGVTTIYNIVGNVTDASGCTVAGSGSATITVNPAITSAVLSGNATICSGTNTNLIVTITGGTGPYSLTLDNGVGLINNYNSGDPIPVSPAATTTYNIVGNVTDASGCTVAGSGSATVTVNPSPTSAVLSGTTTICTGGTANLIITVTSGTGPFSFTIDNGVGLINNYNSGDPIPVSPGANTTYNIVGNVTDANGCSVAGGGSATITVTSAPTSAVLSGDATICAGANTNLIVTITGGSGPFSFTIDNGVGLINNYNSGDPIPVNPGTTTTYNIVGNVTGASGCSVAGSGSATVTVNPGITSAVLSGNATICSGTNTNLIVTITGGMGPYSFTIDNGVGLISNYNSGDPISVSPGATTTYNIVGNVTDASGCTVAGSGSATVTVNPGITSAVLSGNTSICAGNSTNLIVTITGGTGPYSLTIDNGVGIINNYNSGDPIAVNPGATTTYNILGNVTDAAGCTVAGSGSATVTVSTPPTSAVLSGNATICAGNNTDLVVTIAGGTGPFSFTIDNGVGLINNYNSGDPIPVSPGATTTYNILGNVTDATGCTVAGSGSATVTVNPGITSAILSGNATICSGTNTNLIVTITGGTGPYSFTIDNGVGLINNYNSGDPIPVNPGATTTYNIVGNVTDASGCTVAGSGSATVTVNPSPTSAVLSGTTTICTGGTANLTVTITDGTGPFSFTIDNGVGLINNYNSGDPIPISPAANTTYNIVGNVTDAAGCIVAGSGSATVTVTAAPTSAVLSGDATICAGSSTNLAVTVTGGSGPFSFTIDNGVGLINNYNSGDPIPVSPGANTTYNIVGNVTGASGCTVAGSGSATVNVISSPTSAVLSGNATICSGTNTNLIVTIAGGTGPYSFTIDNGVGAINNYNSGDPISVSPGATTIYNITGNVTDANGCAVAGSGSATVTVNPSPASAVLNGTTTICTGGTANLVVTIASGTGPFSFTIDNGVGLINNYNSGDPIPISPGANTTYSIVGNVTDATGCTVAGSGSATITITAPPTSAVLSGDATICAGSTTNLVVTVTGGAGPYSFTIDNGVGLINNYNSGDPIPVIPGATTTYNILGNVTGASACSVAGSGSATVTVNPTPTITLGTSPSVCSGAASANLTYSATTNSPDEYSIDFDVAAELQGFTDVVNNALPASPIPITVPGAAAVGTYNATLSVRISGTGCSSASTPITVTINSLETANAGPDQLVCGTNNVTLSGNASAFGTWSVISVSPPGSPNGTVLSPNDPNSIFVGNSGVAYTLRWIINNPGCGGLTVDDVVINMNAAPALTGTTVVCRNNAPPTLQATATGANTIRWYSDAGLTNLVHTGASFSGINMSVIAQSTFYVVAEYGCGVSPASSITVDVIGCGGGGGGGNVSCTPFTVDIDDTRPSCANQDDGVLVFNVTGGSGNYVITLYDSVSDPSDIFSKGLAGPSPITFSNLPARNYLYRIDDGTNICTLPFSLPMQTTVTATVDPTSFENTVCSGEPLGKAIINATGSSTGLYYYSVDGQAWTQFVPGAAGISDLPPNGTYPVLIGESPGDVCYDTVMVTINDANPAITATFDVVSATCNGNDGAITVTPGSGGGVPYEFSLNGGIFQTDPTFGDLGGGSYTVTVKDGIGCTKDFVSNVSFPGFVNHLIDFIEDANCDDNGNSGSFRFTILDGGSFDVAISTNQFTEPSDDQYQSYPPSAPFVAFEGLSKGTYYVYVKSSTATSCPTRSAPVDIGGVDALYFTVETLCDGLELSLELGDIRLNSNYPYTIYILPVSPSNPVETDTVGPLMPFVDPSFVTRTLKLGYDDHEFLRNPGEYKIVMEQFITGFDPCFLTYDTTFIVRPQLHAQSGLTTKSLPEVPTGSMTLINFLGAPEFAVQIQLDSPYVFGQSHVDLDTAIFDSESGYEVKFSELPAGRYTAIVTDAYGCTYPVSVHVPLDTDIFIPNIFTPNEDGLNEVFYVRNLPLDTPTKLVITNRWGGTVYTSEDYKNDWDGQGIADGVYFYRLQISGGSAISGWVEILRGTKP